jgi:hypothetical protein
LILRQSRKPFVRAKKEKPKAVKEVEVKEAMDGDVE